MRQLDVRPERATRTRQLHRKSSNMHLSRRRARTRQYDGNMPHVRDTNDEARARALFSDWVQKVVQSFAEKKVSKRQLGIKSGVNRNTIDRWIKMETFPEPESVRTFCDSLGLEYGEPARILGWSPAPAEVPAPSPDDTGESIRRLREIAAHPGTSEARRRALETRIAAAEQARQAAATSRLNAEQMERTAEALLREALDEPENAGDQ